MPPISLEPLVRQILITSQGNIRVDLASTGHLSSADAVLELIFHFLLVDLPSFFCYWSCQLRRLSFVLCVESSLQILLGLLARFSGPGK